MRTLNHGQPRPTSAAYRVTGQYLARAHLNRQQRTKLAAAFSTGVAMVYPLTAQQSAALARVPVADVTKLRRNGNGSKPRRSRETLAEHIVRSSPAERAQAGRDVGPDVMWDAFIAPVIDEERGKALVEICLAEAKQAAAETNATA